MAKNTQTVSDEQIISALMTAETAQKAAEMCGVIRWTDDNLHLSTFLLIILKGVQMIGKVYR